MLSLAVRSPRPARRTKHNGEQLKTFNKMTRVRYAEFLPDTETRSPPHVTIALIARTIVSGISGKGVGNHVPGVAQLTPIGSPTMRRCKAACGQRHSFGDGRGNRLLTAFAIGGQRGIRSRDRQQWPQQQKTVPHRSPRSLGFALGFAGADTERHRGAIAHDPLWRS
jgi:hypothetical protein